MKNKYHVYLGKNTEDKQSKIATFDNLDNAEEFIAKVIKTLQVKTQYIQKTRNSKNCYVYNCNNGMKFLLKICEE